LTQSRAPVFLLLIQAADLTPQKMPSTRNLPFVYLNVATTADGKLAPANRHFVPFGSKRDQELLLELRAAADAVMSGARTVGPMPVNLGPGPAKYRKMRLRKGLPNTICESW
jgi:hypothetical protein